MKYIYIAGALNGDACTYIQNLNKMTKYAGKVMKEGFAVYNPGNDFIQGVVNGNMTYDDYVTNTMAFLYKCDAVALVPLNYINSNGTRKEIIEARNHNKFILYTFDDVLRYKKHPEAFELDVDQHDIIYYGYEMAVERAKERGK